MMTEAEREQYLNEHIPGRNDYIYYVIAFTVIILILIGATLFTIYGPHPYNVWTT